MRDIYLVNYSVKGIKTIDELVSLSFYKKIISEKPDFQEYNIKGIYGMNGSGKSGIITSVNVLKNLLINPEYLNNPLVQKSLDAIINKRTGELFIEADYVVEVDGKWTLFRYRITLSRDFGGKYIISKEQLFSKKVSSKNDSMEIIFEIVKGEIQFLWGKEKDEYIELILKRTANLLETASLCALFIEKILSSVAAKNEKHSNYLLASLALLYILGSQISVYLDQSDDHRDYIIQNSLMYLEDMESRNSRIDSLMENVFREDMYAVKEIMVSENFISQSNYKQFENTIDKLCEFLQIFKSDLQKIEIDKKEDHGIFVCNLIMVYDSYKIHAEFESTGIKKLIKLFAYLREMVHGGIVFIDEFDSNLHDVYLCALLEYLMEYGKGQLCFTTHNVGPMDILKQRKKSIDFLSVDHKVYPWVTNGNYSPSRLYRNGMIEGSPFNIDSIDFIGIFGNDGEEE